MFGTLKVKYLFKHMLYLSFSLRKTHQIIPISHNMFTYLFGLFFEDIAVIYFAFYIKMLSPIVAAIRGPLMH